MYRQIMDPDHKDREVDGKDPKHEHQQGVGIVVEVRVGSVALSKISIGRFQPITPSVGAYRLMRQS